MELRTEEEARTDARRIPSSSEDFTLASITSDAKGLKMTIRNLASRTRQTEEQNGGETRTRTFIPETSVPISNFSFPDFDEVKHTDTQTDVMQDSIRIFLVDFVCDCLVRWRAKVGWQDGDRVLEWIGRGWCEKERNIPL